MADNFVWDPRVPAEKQFSWFNVTTWADRDWEAAKRVYELRADRARYTALDPEHALKVARADLTHAREDYRRRVLTWYVKLCLPIVPGETTPTRVAELLAESWDLGELNKLMGLK